MKRAIFPNEKSLQPIPIEAGAHANISGNVNSHTNTTQLFQDQNTPTSDTSSPTEGNLVTSVANSGFYIELFLISVLIIGILIFIYKKFSQKYKIEIGK